MPRQISVSEYAQRYNLHERSVYRRIQPGKVEADKVDGSWVREIDDDISQGVSHDKDMTIVQLQVENNRLKDEVIYLRKQLDDAKDEHQRINQLIQQMQTDAAEVKQRSDTIVLQLTLKFDEQTKLLEDLRQKQDAKWLKRWFRR